MSGLAVTLYRGEGPRFVDVAVPGVELDGEPIELELRWRRRGRAAHTLALSTADASLQMSEEGLRFLITAEEIDDLPDEGATGDIFQYVGD